MEWTAIELATGQAVDRGVDRERLVDNQRSRAAPPVLRWAAGHLLRRTRTTVDQLRGRAAVRKLALQIMADRVDPDAALRLARSDPDASIRRWAPALEAEPTSTPATLF